MTDSPTLADQVRAYACDHCRDEPRGESTHTDCWHLQRAALVIEQIDAVRRG